ncbi:MAG: PhzF family phenazine biosynthesis protein [Intrasporangium sp.]|uniref:PhzF family phenazine biosynthesis protein n=1 Tax=Intrasporangium sp. TaxID=1925024 RepID=UPI002649D652|nr:PhzF family phenazine biosynthesis protein [Intrasporangium sp.]MDN5798098.1 PhzF family phenazine biosynthesis protein [Intrasporangium sp.]
MDLPFRLLNVFGIEGDPFSGNPLAVFPDAAELSGAQMQSWARQLNLSETTFVTAVDRHACSADVRIFTPSYEMPFAGHPTLGTAHVVAGLIGGLLDSAEPGSRAALPDALSLSMPAGRIPVRRVGPTWRLSAGTPSFRSPSFTRDELARTLGLPVEAVAAGGTRLVNVGVEQAMVRLESAEAVRACSPDIALMYQHLGGVGPAPHVYVWAYTGEATVEARLFAAGDGSLDEDPATGSACSNLGGWLVGEGARGIRIEVSQGAAVGRPSRLELTVDDDGGIHVAGRVAEVGVGTMHVG